MARLFLIDSFGYIFRAFYARARSAAPPMRTSTGVSTEAVYIFHNMVRKLVSTWKPDYLAAVFESEGPTIREQEFADYKANRVETPPDLLEQIPLVRRLLDAMRIPVLEYAGFEADDVIGTISRRAREQGLEVVIVSSDKDMLQLVGDGISMLNPAKDDALYDPEKVKEFMGVVPEQVADLLALKGDAVDNIPGAPGIGDKGARDLILQFGSVEDALDRASEVQKRTYRESLQSNREQILLSKRLATIETAVPVEWSLDKLAVQNADTGALREIYRELEFFSLLKELGGEEQEAAGGEAYRSFEDPAEVRAYLASLDPEQPLAVSFFDGQVGLCASSGQGRAVRPEMLGEVRAWLEDASRRKIAHDVKSLLQQLAAAGVDARGFGRDVMLEAFLLNADPGGCALETLAERHLREKLGARAEQRADFTLRLAGEFAPLLESEGLGSLYRDIELPLAAVLLKMEHAGIRIEPAELERMSRMMAENIDRLTAEIHSIAGHEFNINSPKQLAEVLFEEMNILPPGRPGRGKPTSTAADVLEELAPEYPIAAKVLEYRALAKLKNTYVDALPELIRASTGRLHTTFNQAGAATGRLSSSNPNLQNIPIRTELGRQIRAAFVPEPGWKLIVADYSQIELRLLAHMSHDAVLVDAFRRGEDIHTRTAAEVFGVPPLMVTPEMRRNAKAVNFGIVYGQTAFGLAAQLGIDRTEADEYIRSYFERYAGVRKFIDATVAEVRKTGVVRTLFGRKRPIPDINSRNQNARGFAERTAVNTPLQGTAADLIKLAMIRIDALLDRNGYRTRMLLQVHDELLFESPPEEVDELRKLVKREMEGVYRLEVPLLVDVGAGGNWRDAK